MHDLEPEPGPQRGSSDKKYKSAGVKKNNDPRRIIFRRREMTPVIILRRKMTFCL